MSDRTQASSGMHALEVSTSPAIQPTTFMSAYFIANVEVHSPDIYENYRRHTLATIEKYQGKFIVRGGNPKVLEGTWLPSRLVILEFPSMEMLQTWYRSPEYQSIIGARQQGAHSEVVIVEGFTPT